MTAISKQTEALYAAALLSVPGLGSRTLCKLRSRFGSAETVWNSKTEDLAPALPERCRLALDRCRGSYDWDQQIARLARFHVKLIALWDENYPPLLRSTYNPPVVLYCRGELPSFQRTIAVVGARKASPYGRNVAQSLAEHLAARGVAIVSGGARGIDTKAHEGALRAGGATVAVAANGLDQTYPPENKNLFAAIADNGGAVISEYPFGTAPAPMSFPARNRIIAGMSHGVAVVEAALRSGSLITADFALEEGRDVFAVPGSIYSKTSRGTNELLRKGAIILTSPDDVLAEYGWTCPHAASPSEEPVLSEQEKAVVNVLSPERALSMEELIAAAHMSPSQLAPILLRLQLRGLVDEAGGTGYIKKPNL